MVGIAFAYALLTVLVTYPAVLQTTSAPAGLDNEDAFQYVWSLWWTKKALLDLNSSPAHLTHLYHPSEPYHPMLAIDPFVQIMALPLVLIGGPIIAYNLEFLLSFILTGLGTYLLCYYLTKDILASFVGGVIFAFFPNKMLHSLGHLPQITLYLFPIYVLFLFLLLAKPNLKRAMGLGLVLALSLLVYIIHTAYFLIPCTLVFFLWHLATDRRRILAPDFLKYVAFAFLVACLLTGPILVPFLVGRISGELAYLQAGGSGAYSADVLNFLTPSSDHPLLGPLLRRLPIPIPGHKDDETLVYMGLVALALATVGCTKNWRRGGMWVVLGSSAALLACGPLLKAGGEPVQLILAGRAWRVSLPYAALLRLPFYEWGRNPSRLVDTAMFSLAVLSSYGTASLLTHSGTLKSKIALVAVLVTVIFFEYVIVFPFPVGQTPIPDFYRQLASEAEDYAILDIPFSPWSASNTNMYYQTVHGKRIVGGFVHRVPAGVRPMMSFFRRLVSPSAETIDIVSPLSGRDRAAILRHYQIAYVVLHKPALPSEELPLWFDFLEASQAERSYEDDQIAAFRVRDVGEADGLRPLLVVGENWHEVQVSPGAASRRMANDGIIYAGVSQDDKYELKFVAAPRDAGRRLRLFVDDEAVGEFYVAGRGAYTAGPLSLQGQSWSTIRFHTVGGCEEPAGESPDLQQGCFVIENVRLEPI
jgi:hypothetical protein